jgi:hypothetical protein
MYISKYKNIVMNSSSHELIQNIINYNYDERQITTSIEAYILIMITTKTSNLFLICLLNRNISFRAVNWQVLQ